MPDTLLPKLLQKVQDLEKFANDSKNDRNKIIIKINKLHEWLLDDRSLLEHRCCYAFMQYIYQSHGEQFKSFDGFVSWLKCKCGIAKVEITEATIKGQKVIFQKFLVESLSFGSCTQKKFHKFFNELQSFAEHTWKVKFSEWHKEYKTNAGTLQ